MTARRMATGALVLSACCALSCAATEPELHDNVKQPEWVTKGSGAFEDERGAAFYGVGSVSGISSSQPLGRTIADNQARAQALGLFATFSNTLIISYARTMGAIASEEDEIIHGLHRVVGGKHLERELIIARWEDGGTFCALARIKISDAIAAVAADVNDKAREHIKTHGDEIFREFFLEPIGKVTE